MRERSAKRDRPKLHWRGPAEVPRNGSSDHGR
jgi:hypothetical protein